MKKTLKIKRVFAWSVYNNLKQTPPKEYPTTGEIKSTISDVLPALKEHVNEYIKMIVQAVEINDKALAKELTESEIKISIDKINEEWRIYTREHGNEIIEFTLDEEGFKTLKSQFDREDWGKKWVANLEEYAELSDAFTDAGK